MNNSSLPRLYEELCELHSQMEEFALAQNWLEVIPLQEKANSLLNQIKAHPIQTSGASQAKYQAALIREILIKQIAIKQEISDWQSDVRPLLDALRPD